MFNMEEVGSLLYYYTTMVLFEGWMKAIVMGIKGVLKLCTGSWEPLFEEGRDCYR